jgi:thiosulfate reductase cytochrome b subunit
MHQKNDSIIINENFKAKSIAISCFCSFIVMLVLVNYLIVYLDNASVRKDFVDNSRKHFLDFYVDCLSTGREVMNF